VAPDIAILEIVDLTHDGRGVGRLAGKTVFVPGTLPGESVEVRIVRRHARHDEARLVGLRQAAPERVVPPCPHIEDCGGCTLQHLAAEAQPRLRRRQLEQSLTRIARLAPGRWFDTLVGEPWGYRARARLAVWREPGTGCARLGYRAAESRRVAAVAHCAVLDPVLSGLIAPMASALSAIPVEETPRELLLACGDEGVGAALVSQYPLGPMARERLLQLAADEGIALGFGVQRGARDVAWEDPAPELGYCPADGIRIAFAPWDFTQANRTLNRALVQRVIAWLAPAPGDRVLDLFCGLGNFSLPLARRASEVLGVEGLAAQVSRARANADLNGIANCRFEQAMLDRDPGGSGWAAARPDLVLLDPPRTGAAALMPWLGRCGARRICYVSCDAGTLSRDAARLAAAGYRLDAAGALEMFPHTTHFEAVALFTR
jgi:23S rRNA (uracil1939-C5)-methyltransferase